MGKTNKAIKIAVDCRMLKMSGIGVYLSSVLRYWLQRQDVHWLLIGDEKELSSLPLTERCRILQCNIPIFSHKELFRFPTKEINGCDIFYSPNFNVPMGIKIPTYITVHDVVFLDYKSFDTRFKVFLRRMMLWRTIKKAKKIFTVSSFSKERIEAHFGSSRQIIVAFNGLSEELLSFQPETSKPYNFDYLLFIGNIKRHKGIDILIDAMQGLGKKLVIVGKIDGLKTSDKVTIERMRENENIVLSGRVESNAALYNLIAHAEALIQPSRYEGFGIPPLEALALGTRAIISDIPVFREVYADLPVVFFENENTNSLREKILNPKNTVIDTEKAKSAYSYKDTAEKIFQAFGFNL